MFFLATLHQNIFLECKFFDCEIKTKIISNLMSTVEGNKIGPFGIVIAVIAISSHWDRGKILPGSPSALYNISYKAITFRVFKGEILDSVVTNCTNLGFFCDSGSLQIFVSKQFISNEYQFIQAAKVYRNQFQEDRVIKKDMFMRIKIISLREGSDYSQAIGSIDEKFLGVK